MERAVAPSGDHETPRNGDGKSDISLIRKLISINGGVIDAELDIQGILTGRLSPKTQYLCLGRLPVEKDTPPDVLRKYDVFTERAHGLGVQVIELDGLLRSEKPASRKGGPSPFRDRQPPGRGFGRAF